MGTIFPRVFSEFFFPSLNSSSLCKTEGRCTPCPFTLREAMKASQESFRDLDLVFSVILQGTGPNVWLSPVKIKAAKNLHLTLKQDNLEKKIWPLSSMTESGVWGLNWDWFTVALGLVLSESEGGTWTSYGRDEVLGRVGEEKTSAEIT